MNDPQRKFSLRCLGLSEIDPIRQHDLVEENLDLTGLMLKKILYTQAIYLN